MDFMNKKVLLSLNIFFSHIMNNMRIDGQNWFSGLGFVIIWIFFLPSISLLFQKEYNYLNQVYRWSFPSLMVFILTCATQMGKIELIPAPFVVMVFIVLTVLGIIRVVERNKENPSENSISTKVRSSDKRLFTFLFLVIISLIVGIAYYTQNTNDDDWDNAIPFEEWEKQQNK